MQIGWEIAGTNGIKMSIDIPDENILFEGGINNAINYIKSITEKQCEINICSYIDEKILKKELKKIFKKKK